MKTIKPSFPLEIGIFVTGRCNFNCIHCSSSYIRHTKDIPLMVIKKIVDEIARKKSFTVNVTGGEPFLREDMIDILKYIESKNLNIHINTNGSLLTKKIAKELSNINITHIDVTVHAISPNVFKNFCRTSTRNLQNVLKGLKYAKKYSLPVAITCTLTKINWKDYLKVIKKVTSFKLDTFFAATLVHPSGEGLKNFKKLFIDYDKYPMIIDKLDRAAKKYQTEIMVQVPFPSHPTSQINNLRGRNDTGCPCGEFSCFICPDGKVIFCPYAFDEFFILGNIFEGSLSKIWNSNVLSWKKERIKNITGRCKFCKFLDICKGGCPVDTFYLTGKLENSYPLCPSKNIRKG